MKIDSLHNSSISLVNNNQEATAESKKAQVQPQNAQAQDAAKKDTVSLSDRSRLVARAQEIVGQTPEVRQEKVDALKAQISAGTYNVSGQTVADSMIKKGFLI